MKFNSRIYTRAVALLTVFAASCTVVAQVSDPRAGTEQEVAAANSMCPVSPDEPIDPSFSVEYEATRVFFCCKRCRSKFMQQPTAYAEGLAAVMPVVLAAKIQIDQEFQPLDHGDQDDRPSHAEDDSQAFSGNEGAARDHADDEHDHATDHGVSLVDFIGRFHVVIIHFPIAFISLAGLVEVIGWARRRTQLDSTVRILIWFGTIGAVAAMVLGLMHGSASDYVGMLSRVFWWHRALGIATATMAIAACAAVEHRARAGAQKRGNSATALLLLAAITTGTTGHFGGSLVYGWEYLLP